MLGSSHGLVGNSALVCQSARRSFGEHAAGHSGLPHLQQSADNQSRLGRQREMISTYYEDDLADGSTNTNTIAELGKIPVNSVRTSQSTVSFGKRGSGIE